jgi:hypothetical protein
MAIAFDATSGSGNITGTNTTSVAHTCTGTNRILYVGVQITEAATTVTGITYNSVALTKISGKDVPNGSRRVELWYLIAPATGANNIVVTLSGTPANWFSVGAISYTGAKQSGQPEAYAESSADAGYTNFSQAVTTLTDNAWLVGVMCNGCAQLSGGPVSFNAGTTARQSLYNRVGAGFEMFMLDSNAAKTPAGSFSLGVTSDNTGGTVIVASIPQALSIVAETANFTVTGNAATVGLLYIMAAAVGNFILAGANATLRYTGWQKPYTKASTTFTNGTSKSNTTWTNQPK